MTASFDRFTNLASSTLGAGGIAASGSPVTFNMTSATGFPVAGSFRILIGNELLRVYAGAGTNSWTADRPMESTAMAAHIAGDAVTHIVTAFEYNSFRQEYNAVAYGGVGDGVNNEVTALQNAVNDAHVNGAPVYIPQGVSGTWKLNSALTTYSNVVFLTSGCVFTGTGASSVAPLINMTLNGTVLGAIISSSGDTGATAASRWVGATTTSFPATGAHLIGDWIVTQDGRIWICTTAGTPGTWQQPAPPLTFGSAGDIANLAASAAAGASGKVADASHVHAWTGLGVLSITNTWAALNTFGSGLTLSGGTMALGSQAFTKTRNASDTIPVINAKTPDTVLTGVQIWIGVTDPTSVANNGDLWVAG
jgi:hypothetical protein